MQCEAELGSCQTPLPQEFCDWLCLFTHYPVSAHFFFFCQKEWDKYIELNSVAQDNCFCLLKDKKTDYFFMYILSPVTPETSNDSISLFISICYHCQIVKLLIYEQSQLSWSLMKILFEYTSNWIIWHFQTVLISHFYCMPMNKCFYHVKSPSILA